MSHLSPAQLADQIAAYVRQRTEAMIDRFFPNFTFAGYFAGFHIFANERANLAHILTNLTRYGMNDIAGYAMPEAIARTIREVDGPRTETFYSYRISEALLPFGAFEDNPVLQDFSATERENIAQACDSSHIFNQRGRPLGGRPNNYWGVLARCEYGRQQLGLLRDSSILDHALAQINQVMFSNPLGFFDDSHNLDGRYDIYSGDTYLFLEPLWHLLDQAKIQHSLHQHVRLLEDIAMENGAFVVWGRSVGALSICLTMEMAAMALHQQLTHHPGRMLGLLENAFQAYQTWFSDDMITAHRGKMTYRYRGPHRLLEMSTDNLAKLAYAAAQLKEAAAHLPPELDPGELFPPRDLFIPLHSDGPGVWMFRNAHLAFQLPLVNHVGADYTPWFRSPGLFEGPVDSHLLPGQPRLVYQGREYAMRGLPIEYEKDENSLTLVYENFTPLTYTDPYYEHVYHNDAAANAPDVLRGRRVVQYRIEDDRIHADEHWVFDTPPDAVALQIPETSRALNLSLACESPFQQHKVMVDGMTVWRSFWGELKAVHEVNFQPQREIRFSYVLKPRLHIITTPGDHDYVRSLYDAMPPDTLTERPLPNGQAVANMNLAYLGQADILHVGWPEHFYRPGLLSPGAFLEQYLAFVEDVGRSPIRVVWTMHNRLPHKMQDERGRRLYEAWARIADVVIHHSEWGMQLMRAELPYKESARHVVMPHGHFGAQMPRRQPRREVEAALGLQPCAMRFGVLGRPQPEKQVELILRAFHAAGRPDQQLFVNAVTTETPIPDDPRIIVRHDYVNGMLSRDEIAPLVQVCDALVSAHTGPTYLTSGLVADAVGMGIPMLVPPWPFFDEILGPAGLTYDGSEASLTERFRTITPEQLAAGAAASAALQDRYAWPNLAQQLLPLLEALGCARR